MVQTKRPSTTGQQFQPMWPRTPWPQNNFKWRYRFPEIFEPLASKIDALWERADLSKVDRWDLLDLARRLYAINSNNSYDWWNHVCAKHTEHDHLINELKRDLSDFGNKLTNIERRLADPSRYDPV